MTTVTLHYVIIVTGEDDFEVPDGTLNPSMEAIRIAQQTKPFLRGATFEVVAIKESDDDIEVPQP